MTRRLSMEALLASPEEVRTLRRLLEAGGVAAIPTETFYALAGNPNSEKAVARIFEMKGRNSEKALPVLFSGREQLATLRIEDSAAWDRFFALWPAPLTVILPTTGPVACAGSDSSLAVRIPSRDDLRELLQETGPLTGTSANPSGRPPLSDPNEIEIAFGRGDLDLLVDGGITPGVRPSTLVDSRFDPPRVLRRGAFPWPETG
ncbi:MAG: L-threonylcarbamoyladenylate synthase [Thermoanaerobaculia bacterium]